MANAMATLVVQTELLPPQSSAPLSPFPSLLAAGDEGEEVGDAQELEKADAQVVLAGVQLESPGRVTQNPEHPFQCLDCGKSFKWSSRLAHHQRSHNNERPYRCNLCPKAFKGSSALLYHQRNHSGEKPYKCEDCGKAFKRSSLLQVHRSVHTGLRTFQCPYCPLTFKWSSHYQYHLRQHTGECPYPCDTCSKAFKNSSSLRRHKNAHLGLRPYVCAVCSKAFSQSTNLRQHMRIHTGERPYVCGECGRSFTHSSNMALHRSSHCTEGKKKGGRRKEAVPAHQSSAPLEVAVADVVAFVGQEEATTTGEEVFLSHHVPNQAQTLLPEITLPPASQGAGTEMLLYSCGSCSQTFGTHGDLKEHQTLHLGDHGGRGVPLGVESGPGVGLVGTEPLLADFEEVVETTAAPEGATAPDILSLDSSTTAQRQEGFDLLQSLEGVSQLSNTGVTNRGGGVTECSYCGKSFRTSGGLNRHVSQAHSLTPSQSRSQFSCSACDRSFSLLSSLLTHQHSHTPEQRLLAEAEAEIVCPPSLSLSLPLPSLPGGKGREGDEAEREIHVSLITVTEEGGREATKPARGGGRGQKKSLSNKVAGGTNSERPYRCSECGKCFKGSSGLRYHMRDHTGERPYRCTECGKSFKRSSLLSIHQRVHTGVRAFQCPYCPLNFKWSSHYQYHLRQHTGERPYVCQECGKSFKNTSCLRRHSQLHSGLRPHACSVCGKAFSQTSNLKQHERTHSGERPFQCAQCHKSFTHSSNLQLHLRTHFARKDYKCHLCGKEFVMHSYLQRHLRTHVKGSHLGKAPKVASLTGTSNSGCFPELSTKSTLILSSSNLDIPPNTSQNYFMIQTPTGLQLIPLSTPAPAPPPPPPPVPPSQNYFLLQCQATNGSQPSLLLVPASSTSSNTSSLPPPTPQPISVVQTMPALQPVFTGNQTQIPHFQTIPPQPKFILTSTPTTPTLLNSPPSRVLGKVCPTRKPRARRGRKPKASKTQSQPNETSTAFQPHQTLSLGPVTTSGQLLTLPSTTSPQPQASCPSAFSSPSLPHPSVTSSISVVSTCSTTNPSTTPLSHEPNLWVSNCSSSEQQSSSTVEGKQLVLCFGNHVDEGGKKDGLNVECSSREEYVLQSAGEGVEERGRDSLVLKVQTKPGNVRDKDGVVSLDLLEWDRREKVDERSSGIVGRVERGGESLVLHFQTEGISSSNVVPQAQSHDINLDIQPDQALVPLGEQEVVFELRDGDKMVGQGSGESLQMIALIKEGKVSDSGVGDGYTGSGGEDGTGVSSRTMEGIFQLEGGEGIVIIEVSTSSLREVDGEGSTIGKQGESNVPDLREGVVLHHMAGRAEDEANTRSRTGS